MTELSAQHQQFCQEYLIDFNGAAAYVRAGYSEVGAAQSASKLLRNPNIQAYLQILRDKADLLWGGTLADLHDELCAIAFSNICDVVEFSEKGVSLRDSKKLDKRVTRTVQSITTSTSESGTRTTVKLHGKMEALALLARFYGIDSDFNQARAALKRYGIAMVPDESASCGWRLAAFEG